MDLVTALSNFLGIEIANTADLIQVSLVALSAVLGTKYNKYKKLFRKVVDAVEDDKITEEERKSIVKLIKGD